LAGNQTPFFEVGSNNPLHITLTLPQQMLLGITCHGTPFLDRVGGKIIKVLGIAPQAC
jgi:hypothetical protein